MHDVRRSLAEWARSWRRHDPDLLVHDPDGPVESLVRAGQLLVDAESADAAAAALGPLVDRVAIDPQAESATLWLTTEAAARCVELADELPTELGVAVNHVHLGCPILFGTAVRTGQQPDPPPVEQWRPPVTVAVLDGAVRQHPWLAGRQVADWGSAPPTADALAAAGTVHGRFVTGVLLRHAPGVTVRHRAVLSAHGLTDDRTVVGALRAVRRRALHGGEHLSVVLLGAGCHTVDDRCPPLLARELGQFGDAAVVAPAGNGGTDRPFWPAAAPDVVAVAATRTGGELAEFSNRGDWVDAAAPGVDLVGPDGLRCSGTSFAAPAVAGEIAALCHVGLPVELARQRACRRYPVRR